MPARTITDTVGFQATVTLDHGDDLDTMVYVFVTRQYERLTQLPDSE
jgi:hypothetical protein